jgi:hypothetical protein
VPELIDDLAENLRLKLKASKGNPADLLALRTAIQVMRPELDQLTRAALPVLRKHLGEFSGTFLDVGCYGGWVYPYVRDQVEYHGIDTWPTGIESAEKMFGKRFELSDLFNYEKKHDVVWCSQILFTGLYKEAWEKCKSLANKLCVFVTPEGNVEFFGASETYSEGRMTIAVWRG